MKIARMPRTGRLLSLVVAVLLLSMVGLVVAGCQPAKPAEETPEEVTTTEEAVTTEEVTEEVTPEEAKKPVKVALVLIGEITDISWNAQAYRALMELKDKLGVEVAFSEQVSEADAERVLREYAEGGYNLIIAHSFSFGDTVFRVAPDYPDVGFAWAGGINKTAQNVADYDQPFYQGSYLIGMIAGSMTKTNKVGSLSGFDIPVCHSMGEAFKLGAQSVNPDVEGLYTQVGDWGDVAKAKEAALAQAEAGADFFNACGEGPTLGAIEAAKEKGAYASGYVGDMSTIAPDTVVVSLMWDLYGLYGQMVKDVEEGTFQPGKYYSFGIKEDGVKIAINPNFEDKIPKEVLDEVEKVREQIATGAFEVPYIPEAEQ